jgi:hypothetical protein
LALPSNFHWPLSLRRADENVIRLLA